MTMKRVATCDLCGREEKTSTSHQGVIRPAGWVFHSHDGFVGDACEDCSAALQEAVDDAVSAVVEARKGSAKV